MMGIRRPLYNLTAVCCFLAGSLLSLPGDGKNGSSASSSTVSQFTLPHTEARNFQATATNRDNIIKSTSQVNVSSISQPDYLTTTKPGYLNTTARIQTQTANNASNGSTDPSLFLTPTSHLLETNTFGSDGDRRYISATSLLTSSTKILATEILQSKETQGLPSRPVVSPIGNDPLVIAVIVIFVVTVGILTFLGFLRYRQRSNRLRFRRLQDLPMDDMMEDTPLSLYSY
ncbi:uncharacterized protein LOC116509536 isoform X3 [Thamnophis elegans]|uniref:uncharacterized protein LOC116509536 isoform X3 n=1 Tax=Thamnophis elegans TaxID=35005 RepID=UPI0013786F5B|nr:uncharacterized protein LOC116509536 isoform X3 [Thamnophis elegans]